MKVPKKVYAMIVDDMKSNNLIEGIVLMNSHWTHVSSSTHSFIDEKFFDSKKLKEKNMSYQLLITIPLGKKNFYETSIEVKVEIQCDTLYV